MGGYNTTTEVLASRKPALIVPRIEPRVEQLIRARRLASLGLVQMIHPHDLTPALMRRKVEELVRRDPPPMPQVRRSTSPARPGRGTRLPPAWQRNTRGPGSVRA